MNGRPRGSRRIGWAALVATAASAALLLAGCAGGGGGGGGSACQAKIVHADAPQVTVWAWYPHFDTIVENFNKAHKDVQVCWSNVGAGGPEYTKLSTAIQAGSGAPDVVMLETDHVPQYVAQQGLADLTKYGADKVKGNFAAGNWSDETVNGGVYAIPVDGGAVGLLYRKDLFDKYGLPVPTTWAQYMDDAKKLKEATAGKTLMTDYQGNGGGGTEAVLAQAGGENPFETSGKTLTIQLDSPQWKQVNEYWGQMVSQKLVGTEDGGTTDYNTHLVDGTYASVIAAAWLPGYLIGLKGADSSAVWAAAPLPQWDPANPVSVNIGGSAFSVTSQASNKKLAAEVAEGIFADDTSLQYGAKNNIIFPLNTTYNTSPAFVDLPYDFFKGQTVNKDVFIPALNAYKGLPASPFQEYFYDQLNTMSGSIIKGSATPDAALATAQASVVKYAKSQGYTVK